MFKNDIENVANLNTSLTWVGQCAGANLTNTDLNVLKNPSPKCLLTTMRLKITQLIFYFINLQFLFDDKKSEKFKLTRLWKRFWVLAENVTFDTVLFLLSMSKIVFKFMLNSTLNISTCKIVRITLKNDTSFYAFNHRRSSSI